MNAATRNLLTRVEIKQRDRRFSAEPITGFGDIGYESAPRESVHVLSAAKRAARILHHDRGATDKGRAVRDLLEANGPSFNHHDFAILMTALQSELDKVRGWDYSLVLDFLQEADEHMEDVESIREADRT
jgi:hypothetical protein